MAPQPRARFGGGDSSRCRSAVAESELLRHRGRALSSRVPAGVGDAGTGGSASSARRGAITARGRFGFHPLSTRPSASARPWEGDPERASRRTICHETRCGRPGQEGGAARRIWPRPCRGNAKRRRLITTMTRVTPARRSSADAPRAAGDAPLGALPNGHRLAAMRPTRRGAVNAGGSGSRSPRAGQYVRSPALSTSRATQCPASFKLREQMRRDRGPSRPLCARPFGDLH
jgi:hypothetical protein